MPRPLRDSTYLYGLHDPGGEQQMLDLGTPGWVLVTEELGYDPSNTSSRDYRSLSDRDLGVLVRLNAGYAKTGTLPYERYYAQFAQRCANFVRNSAGAHHWIVGNETNHPIEWPGADWDWNAAPPEPKTPDTFGEPITAARYAACYKAVRAAIKAVAGHENDLVLVAGAAPWNALLVTPDNPNGDWVTYFRLTLEKIGAGNCDGITLHTYTHGSGPDLISSETRMDAPFQKRRYHFRAYQDFMAAIPPAMRSLPVFITETDQGDIAWHNENTGWVRKAYAEIAAWNRSSTQKIRSLILYRWRQVTNDRWGIAGKAGVIDDFKAAVSQRLRWDAGDDYWAILLRKVEELEQAAADLKPAVESQAKLAPEAVKLHEAAEALARQAAQAELTSLRDRVDALSAKIKGLEDQVGASIVPDVPQPVLIDRRGALPTGTAASYPSRSETAIKRVVVHHTVTRSDITPERVAEVQVNGGKPGITYHFLVAGDGTITWTQPLDVATAQTGKTEANADAIAVALAGNFTNVAPADAQLSTAARLIAWLCANHRLTTADVVGRCELENVGSPGKQWLQGATFKVALLARVQEVLDTAGEDPDKQITRLRRRVAELEVRVSELQAQADQTPTLQARISELEKTVADQQAEIDRLRKLLAAGTGGRVVRPEIVDLVDSLPKHPTLPAYPKRTLPVTMLVIHHTDTGKDYAVQKLAQYHVYGTRKKAGIVVKEQWPGLGYHFVIAADGVIYQGQREHTVSYHVGGDPNGYSIGISLIGRFMKTDLKGNAQPAADQIPTPQQLRSAGHLAAWLMQEHEVPLARVVGHRDVWPKGTVCPGEHWKTGLKWWGLLEQEIKGIQEGQTALKLEHYLLFWDRGSLWAESDWRNAQRYIEHFRTTSGFSVDDALQAQNVTIVGGDAGVSGADEQRLIAAGATVRRLAGKDEAETLALLDELVADNTLWPGATPRTRDGSTERAEVLAEADAELRETLPPAPAYDEWTLDPDWEPPVAGPGEGADYLRVKVPPPTGPMP